MYYGVVDQNRSIALQLVSEQRTRNSWVRWTYCRVIEL